MTSVKRAIGYGLLTWLVPFITGFALYTSDGEPRYDELFTSNIFEIVGGLIGMYLIVQYFKYVKKNHVCEGWLLGIFWLCINIILDLFILIPLSGLSYSEYFLSIGVGYLVIPIITVGAGYLLSTKS